MHAERLAASVDPRVVDFVTNDRICRAGKFEEARYKPGKNMPAKSGEVTPIFRAISDISGATLAVVSAIAPRVT